MTTPTPQRVLNRIFDQIDVRGADECWPWTLSVGSHGYGQVGWYDAELGHCVMTTAHRVAWIAANGAIPDGFDIDHECHNLDATCTSRATCAHLVCCNPAHLVARPKRDNARRNIASRRTHCPQGHPYDDDNTILRQTPTGVHRKCRACRDEKNRARSL